jgi:type II secretion system protein N
MAFPRLRLSRPSFEWLPAVVPSRRIVLYTLYTLLLFLVFLVWQFPHGELVRRALRSVDLSPLRLEFADARFAWLRGYEFQGVELKRVDEQDDRPPILESSRLYLRPGFNGLIRGRLASLKLHAAMYSGNAEGSWEVQNGMHRATLRLEDLRIGRYRWLVSALEEGEIDGLLSGMISAESRRLGARDGELAGELQVKKGHATGLKIRGLAVPELDFARITAKFAVKGDQIELQELHADGLQLKVNASGQLTVRTPPTDSVLNLRVTLQPGPESSDAIRGLLALIPRPKNARPDAPMIVTGTLAQPRVR